MTKIGAFARRHKKALALAGATFLCSANAVLLLSWTMLITGYAIGRGRRRKLVQ